MATKLEYRCPTITRLGNVLSRTEGGGPSGLEVGDLRKKPIEVF